MRKLAIFIGALLVVLAPMTWGMSQKGFFPEAQIPRFNIPKVHSPPQIDGTIDAKEWQRAVCLMGMATAHNNTYRGRPHAFYVAWDENHLYIAGRAHVLKGHVLGKSRRAKFTTGTVFDDAFEFGLSMEGRNQQPGEAASFFKFILNQLGSGEYLKMYPSIGQYLYNWRPEMEMATRFIPDEKNECQWFEIELALDLEDLEMPVENKAGDLIRILLAHDGKNPGWQWTCVPTASGYLVHDGYPRALLTDSEPYIQVEAFDGLNDERLNFKSRLVNPGPKEVEVVVTAFVKSEKYRGRGEAEGKTAFEEKKTLTLPAKGEVRFDLAKEFPGLTAAPEAPKGVTMRGHVGITVALAAAEAGTPPLYNYHLKFHKDEEKKHLQYTPKDLAFNMQTRYNPVTHKIWIEADSLDARLPAGQKAAGAHYAIQQGETTVAEGRIDKFVYYKYQDLVQLPTLAPGTYEVAVSLTDGDGKALLTRTASIEKKDEAKEFPAWWGKTFGNPEQLLRGFEPLKTGRSRDSRTAVTCVNRTFAFDSLGLPVQVTANDGPVLTAPARIVLTIDGREHVVPTRPRLRITERKDWRYRFSGSPTEIAGLRFTASGMMEQDGLVSIELTYEPVKGPVDIQELRIEWPVDDAWHNHMAVMGVGGNYSARFIGAVPAGQGEVWSSKKHIGSAGSGMTVGNFFQNLWIGTEKRGFLFYATSDEGWVPNDSIAAHTIVRDGTTTVVRNHLIGTYPGQAPFQLATPRTVRFSYNASPFKKLMKGWRLNQRSAANGFTKKPKYKWNWDTGKEYFSILSPPFPKRDRWEEYYAHCKEVATGMSRRGIYDTGVRLRPYLTNQIAVRGYMRKSLESHIYNYFAADWETTDAGETLNKTYRDYMMWLQHRQVAEGGCRHFYYDISMCGRISRQLVAGCGYLLPDGRIQPGGTDWELRRWYLRASALMEDNGIFPYGISGHATNTIPLIALPFSDAILDSEFPMKDPITVFPSDRMIALSCPENFGCNINHLGFMNPAWAAMHDAGMGGGHGSVFDGAKWRNWGIEREDVTFIPYWRNRHVVRRIGDGLLCSLWDRPGSVILGIMNYGLDKEGFEQTRQGELVLDLAALGIPQDTQPERVRLRVLNGGAQYPRKFVTHFKWYEELPGTPAKYNKKRILKFRPEIEPQLDLATGALTGFDIHYHDQYFIAIHWDDGKVDDAAWKDDIAQMRAAALNWGIGTAEEITAAGLVTSQTDGFAVRAWQKPHSTMVLLTCTAEKAAMANLTLDIDALGLRVTEDKLWNDFTSVFALGGGGMKNVVLTDEYKEKRKHEFTRGDLVYDGHTGTVIGLMQPGEKRLFCVDKY